MAKQSGGRTKQNMKETDNNDDDGSSVSVDSTLLLHLTVVFKFIFCSYFVRRTIIVMLPTTKLIIIIALRVRPSLCLFNMLYWTCISSLYLSFRSYSSFSYSYNRVIFVYLDSVSICYEVSIVTRFGSFDVKMGTTT